MIKLSEMTVSDREFYGRTPSRHFFDDTGHGHLYEDYAFDRCGGCGNCPDCCPWCCTNGCDDDGEDGYRHLLPQKPGPALYDGFRRKQSVRGRHRNS